MKTTKENDTIKVKNILKNIEHYAFKNGCEFTKTKFKDCDLLDNQPKDLINYNLYDYGLILNFNVSFKKQIVYIEEFSEDSDIKQEMNFKEFIKFQSDFLNDSCLLDTLKDKLKQYGILKIKFYNDDKNKYCVSLLFNESLLNYKEFDTFINDIISTLNGKYGVINLCRGDTSIWNDFCDESDFINDGDIEDFIYIVDLQKVA